MKETPLRRQSPQHPLDLDAQRRVRQKNRYLPSSDSRASLMEPTLSGTRSNSNGELEGRNAVAPLLHTEEGGGGGGGEGGDGRREGERERERESLKAFDETDHQ